MENLVSNGKIGGVMLVFIEGFTETEIRYKTGEIKKFCQTLKERVEQKGGETMATLQYVQPTEEQKELMQKFRDKYQALYEGLKELPASRGLSLALTKLEESAMWLNKSITKND